MKYITKLILVIIFLIIGLLANVISSNIIYRHYSDAPKVEDCILNTIQGTYNWAMPAAEIIIGICIITFLFLLYKKWKEGDPKADILRWLFIIASFELVRGILILLTIYSPISTTSIFNEFITFQQGMFPSGHTALPYLFLLLTFRKTRLWILYLISTAAVIFLLLLGKQHYTIDIIGTIFIGYAIKVFCERNIFRR